MQNDEIIISIGFDGLMILEPLNEQSLLSNATVGLDDEGLIVFLVLSFHIKPLLDHQVIFL